MPGRTRFPVQVRVRVRVRVQRRSVRVLRVAGVPVFRPVVFAVVLLTAAVRAVVRRAGAAFLGEVAR
ncbi:hypothetical protein ACN27F_29030 [Solwaraspora sp. WMMB335]|uniref:hypothetical protein n=1 Tax=Solwaraspora sp. WMMB335 TaxID=3404118 RepID=UPI003B94CCCB